MPGHAPWLVVTDVVSFRPTEEEARMIERARKQIGARSRAAAVRWLLRTGAAKAGTPADDPVFKFRVPKKYRLKPGETMTKERIRDVLYGPEALRDLRRG